MKKFLLPLILLFTFQLSNARMLIVTSSEDDISNPIKGMLRFYANNSQAGDTIIFNVDKVNLNAAIVFDINSPDLIDGSSMDQVVLDGNFKDRILSINFRSALRVLRIKNLTIKNGKLTNGTDGAGANIEGDYNITFENCRFESNYNIHVESVSGGGVFARRAYFVNCLFANNEAYSEDFDSYGGGASSIECRYYNCIFTGNRSDRDAAIVGDARWNRFYNCTFAYNYCNPSLETFDVRVMNGEYYNCIFYNETPAENVYRVEVIKNSAFQLTNITERFIDTENNIELSSSPFRGGNGPDSLYVTVGSGCIDGGDTTDIPYLSTDFEGNPRVLGAAINIGAIENDDVITGWLLVDRKTDVLVYPNPSNGEFFINTQIIDSGISELKVLNTGGNIISDYHGLPFSTSINLAEKGIYFIVITTEKGESFSQKLIVR